MSTVNSVEANASELFKALNAEVTWLHTVWELFAQLFASGDENFATMNATAPQFFAIIKTVLFNEMVMIFNRLTDPPKTSGQANASLERLIEQTDQESQVKLVASLRIRLESIRTNYCAFRTWRNKMVSHNDLAIALKDNDVSLPGITRGQVDTAIREIASFMNEYSLAIYDSEQKYVPFMVARGDGTSLLSSLREGLEKRTKEA